jgi:pantoate--beta-alanine ligase
VQPDVVVLGEKDYQQLVLVRRMVADLCLPVCVTGSPTQREPDGLALSSRNRYLEPEERRRATSLCRALRAAEAAQEQGPAAALRAARAELSIAPGVDPDYLVITGPDLVDLPAEPAPGTQARVLVAARIGGTRLIDNLPLTLGRRTTSHKQEAADAAGDDAAVRSGGKPGNLRV